MLCLPPLGLVTTAVEGYSFSCPRSFSCILVSSEVSHLIFEVNELEAMEDISNTSLLADYFARRRGALLVDVPQFEDLDRVDLFDRAMRTSAARGRVDTVIQRALEDGVIERHEAEEINEYHRRHLAAREEEIRAIVALFSRKKSQKK